MNKLEYHLHNTSRYVSLYVYKQNYEKATLNRPDVEQQSTVEKCFYACLPLTI